MTYVNFRRPEWGEIVQRDKAHFRRLEKHTAFEVRHVHRMPHPDVEWSGNVTAAGYTRRKYGLGSAVGVLRGIMTSLSRQKCEVGVTS